ncbi:hypothetical protein P4E94_19155 [Pontiellaceae bacterium B12219]|nr:hypothetical protein [Pontiellaceae bacterium B12219]
MQNKLHISLVFIASLSLLTSCKEQSKQSHKQSSVITSQESLLRFPETTIHAELPGKYKSKHSCYVKGTGTKHEGSIIAHRGVVSGLRSDDQEPASLSWEFIGQSTWEQGDVYVLKFTDPKDAEKNWVKTIIYTGTPIDVINSDNIRITINEIKQVEPEA